MDPFFLNKNLVAFQDIIIILKNLIKKDINFKIVSSLYKSNFLKNLDNNFKKGYLKRYPDLKIIEKIFQFSNDLCIDKIKPNIVHDTYYQSDLIILNH